MWRAEVVGGPSNVRGHMRELGSNVASALGTKPPYLTLHSIEEVHRLEGAKHVGFGSKTVVMLT